MRTRQSDALWTRIGYWSESIDTATASQKSEFTRVSTRGLRVSARKTELHEGNITYGESQGEDPIAYSTCRDLIASNNNSIPIGTEAGNRLVLNFVPIEGASSSRWSQKP